MIVKIKIFSLPLLICSTHREIREDRPEAHDQDPGLQIGDIVIGQEHPNGGDYKEASEREQRTNRFTERSHLSRLVLVRQVDISEDNRMIGQHATDVR